MSISLPSVDRAHGAAAALESPGKILCFPGPLDTLAGRSYLHHEELIIPTIVRATNSDGVRLVETPVPGGDARALVVCRSEEDARAFMESAGYTEEDGYKPANVDHEELRVLLNACCGRDQVAMPEAWTGSGLVNFFNAEGFVKMLEDSLQEA